MEQSYDQHIQQKVTALYRTMEQRVTPEEMERIKTAYALAEKRVVIHKWDCVFAICLASQNGDSIVAVNDRLFGSFC